MDLTYQELIVLNRMIGIALRSGRIEFNDISESIHKKVAEELIKKAEPEQEVK